MIKPILANAALVGVNLYLAKRSDKKAKEKQGTFDGEIYGISRNAHYVAAGMGIAGVIFGLVSSAVEEE